MEVPGKVDGGAAESSTDSILICLPCESDGLREPAYGFCQDCQEHLCETCYKHHRRARPFKNHVQLDKQSMPKILVSVHTRYDDTEDFCKKHQDKQLEFHCRDHQSVACYVCITLEHKQCKVDYIPDVSRNITDEMNNILQQIESLVSKCKINIENSRKTVQNLDQSHAKVVEEIKVYRKDLNECLDRMEAQIMKEANTIVQDVKGKQHTIKAVSSEITEELEHSHSLLSTLKEERKLNRLFIEMKNVEKSLLVLSDKEKEVLDEHRTDDCIEFHQNTNLIDLLKIVDNYGTLFTNVQPSPDRVIHLQYTKTINVKCRSDKKECFISDMVMIASSKMIVVDNANKNIKMIDVDKGSVVTDIMMSSLPADVIHFLENKLAVTLPGEKSIQIMSYTDSELVLDERIVVGEICSGIAYCKNRFIVTSVPGKIIIFNVNGVPLKVLKNPDLFPSPFRVVISNDEKFLYVSDNVSTLNSKIVKINWKGNLKEVFEEPRYIFPYGLQRLEDDTILVNYRNNGTVLRLSKNLKRCEMIGLEKEIIYKPTAITLCNKEHKLYLSCCSLLDENWSANVVKVFNIKWI